MTLVHTMNMISTIINKLKPERCALGIEITDHSIKIVELSFRRKKLPWLRKYQIEKLAGETVVEGRIMDPFRVIQTLKSMVASMKVRSRDVHIVLPSQLIMVRFLKLPDIPMKDLRKVVEFEMKHNIHLPFESPIYDFIKLNGVQEKAAKKKLSPKEKKKQQEIELSWKEAAPTLENIENVKSNQLFAESKKEVSITGDDEPSFQCDVMLIAAPKELIDEYVEAVQTAGLIPRSIEITALSLYRIIEFTEIVNPLNTFLLVDINESDSDISIFNEGQLKITRNLPLNFSQQKEPDDVLDEPEPLEDLQEPQPNFLFSNIIDKDTEFNGSCSDLVHELERLMNFYRYTLNHRDHEFKQIVLTGDTLRLAEVSQFLKERLTVEIICMFSQKIQIHHNESEQLFPVFSVPIGLALRGNPR